MARLTLIVALALACLASLASAFLPVRSALPALARTSNAAAMAGASSAAAGRRRGVAVMDGKYWEGEWVCADCGYIYDRELFGGMPFEDQKAGFKCPQCSAPRRRFAKKVGDKIGVTRDGGDAPIVLFSIIGGLAVIAFGIYAAFNDF